MGKEQTLGHHSSLSPAESLNELRSSETGLTSGQVKIRLEEYGKNTLVEKKSSILLDILAQFRSPLIWILILATLVSFFFGEVVNAIIIIVMILLGVVLNFYQAYTAGRAVDRLKESIKTTVFVIRDGREKEIKIEEACPGDIVLLAPGRLVPADSRVIYSKELFVNQSALTGESVPSEKTHLKLKGDKRAFSELGNIVFMGTSVVSGTGTAVVINTGARTEFGKISKDLAQNPQITDFERGVKGFSYLIMKAVLLLVIMIFFLNSLMKHNVLESLMFSLAIAVGLTPELLPAIMSINMAKGSLNMAKKGAIVKRLSSIPNFGSMDVLCTDKTGTLTEDKIHLVKYVDAGGKHSDKVLLHAYLNSSFHTGISNPLDLAITTFRKVPIPGYKKIDEIPFDFVRRKMSVVVEKAGKRHLITKGATEEILKSTGSSRQLHKKAMSQYRKLSNEGYRVLAVAMKRVGRKTVYNKNDEHSMEFLGFAVFLDPPKKDAREALKEVQAMHIEIKVITGDNELVTKKICDEIGLEVKGVLTGDEINRLNDDALRVRAERTTIFARFSPDQKNRVINALRANGHVVGYMGDGINDAPSLKTADVGITVNKAVDIAKDSADIVLTHKSLEILRNGVLEGRKTFGNTIKYITMGLSSNFGNMFSVLGAVLYVPFLPMLPIQIMFNNVLYDFSQVTIPSDHVDREYIQRPKRWDMKFLKRFMLIFGPISSVFDLLTYFLLYGVFHAPAAVFQTGWFMESLATQTLVIHVIRTKRTPFLQSIASPWLLFSTAACVAIGWAIPYTRIGAFFGFEPLPAKIALVIAGLVIVYLFVVEMVKRWFYKKYDP